MRINGLMFQLVFKKSPEYVSAHSELVAVEKDPGDIAEDEDEDDADEDEGEIDFFLDRVLGPDVGVPGRDGK